MSEAKSLRVLIADDHPVVRAGIISLLSKEPQIALVGETGAGQQVETLANQIVPDVLVLDVNMPGLDAIGVTRRLTKQFPTLRVLVLTAYDDEAYAAGLLAAGATGYVLKDEALDSLATAIRAVAKGESWLSQRVAGRLARKAVTSTHAAETEAITPREREVLHWLALGLSNDEIAEKLVITRRTVQNHVSSIYGKLGLESRAEAVLYALRHGIVDMSEGKSAVIRLAWQSLWERKVRTVLTLVGVAVCVVALTAVDGMLDYMRVERERDAARFADRLLLQPPGAGYPPFRSMLPEASVTAALGRPDIIPSQSTLLLLLILAPADNPMDIADVIGLGLQPGREQAWLGPVEAAVGQATLSNASDDSVILGKEAARYYGITTPGETITLAHQTWRVIGILQDTGISRWNKLVLMPLASAQTAFGVEGWVSALLLTAPPGQADRLARDLTETYPTLDIYTQETIRTALHKELDIPNRFLGLLSWTAFIMAVLIVANIMSVAVRERAQDIKLIQRIGPKRSTILSYTLSETLMLSLTGGLLGGLVAVPAAYTFFWSWMISWEEMLRVGGLVLAAGLLAGVYPAYRAARAYPQALQYDELQKRMEKVTAEKRAMDQAYRHLVRGREEERERLARELHDQAIQSLVGLKFRLAEQTTEGQAEIQNQVNSVIGTLRELCSDLRPPALDRLGLAASLRAYVNDFAERTGQPVTLHISGNEQRLPPEVELSLFRVAQEALTNAWKHAQAPTVAMELCFDPAAVRLTICDRGRGFTLPERLGALVEAGHFGLVGMHERLLLVGGELQVISQTGEGTTLTARVPSPPS